MARRARHLPVRAVAITAVLLAVLAATAAASSLGGSMGGGATFPARTLVLSAPPGVRVDVPHIYVSENGMPVDYLSVTPMPAVSPADFGVVLVIEQSESMSGAPLAQAMVAARAIAAQRTGRQPLGVVTFDSAPSVVLPMTSDPRTIDRALTRSPWTGVGTNPLSALMAGLKQLSYAHISHGAVILVGDGAATGATKLTAHSVAAAAQAQHAQIYTLGLRDRVYSSATLRQLAGLGGGKFVTASTGSRLPHVLTHLVSAAPRSYLLGYRSILPGNQPVAVTVNVDGVPELLHLSYTAPAVATSTTPSASGTASAGTPSAGTTASGTASSSAKPSAKSSTPRASSAKPSTLRPFPAPSTASSLALLPGAVAPSAGAVAAALPHQSSAPQPAGPPNPTKAQPVSRSRISVQPPRSIAPAARYVPRSPRPSFWTSSLGVVTIAGTCALLFALAIGVLLWRRPARRALQQRVGNFTRAFSSADPEPTALTTNPGGPLTRLLTRRRWWPGFAQQVETARIQREAPEVVKRWAVMSLVAAVLVALVTGSTVLGVLLIVIAPFGLRARVSRGARRQRRAFNDQLPSHLQDLAGAMRAGRSFVGAISGIVESAVEPIRGEFERALYDERLGLPLEDTLEAIGRRMAAKDMEQVALIAALNRNSGSNVAEALERVAESARERADLRREMRALTGQARMSAWVLTGMPPAMLGALTVLAPQYQRPLFHTTVGIILLFVAAGLLAGGWFVMNKIINVEV